MNKPFVLIVSTIADVATDDVIKRLSAKGIEFKRINTEDFPFHGTMTFYPYNVEEDLPLFFNSMEIPNPTSIWYRRFRSSSKPVDMDQGIFDFCIQENRSALMGGILGKTVRWLSHPSAIWESEYKPYQIAVAAKVGLRVPKTVVTNDPTAIKAAFYEYGRMIVKPVRSGHVTYQGNEFTIFTSEVLQGHLQGFDSPSSSPSIYQELIEKRFDIRVTVVGKKLFSAAIDSQTDPQAEVDWRHTENPHLPHHAIDLPYEIENKLLALMTALNLNFGAIDLVQTKSGEFVFLEVNPNGQWLWIDDLLNLGISNAVADWLGEAIYHG